MFGLELKYLDCIIGANRGRLLGATISPIALVSPFCRGMQSWVEVVVIVVDGEMDKKA
jgi:hypothetical protein